MLVRDRMHRDPVTVGPDDTLAHALRLTRRHRIRHLPVVHSGGGLAGILSDRDIRLAMPSPLTVPDAERVEYLEKTPIAAVMTREVMTVFPTDSVEEAARVLYRHRIGSLPVVGPNDELIGIITEADILYAFVQLFGGSEPCSRVEIALADRPGELAGAIRILGEDLRLNIVSIVVPSVPGQQQKRAVIHLATIDPREAVEALERGGFEVERPSLDAGFRRLEGERRT
jgi:acetoin utilization protein AcuB